MSRFVIIGGSDAGISAALRIRELNPAIKPLIIDSDRYPNYSICGLPYFISREVNDWRSLAHRNQDVLRNEGLELLLEHTVKAIQPGAKEITVYDRMGSSTNLKYFKLLLATGAISKRPNISGMDEPGVFFLRWLPDAFKIDKFIETRKPKKVIILGAGYIGIEMTEALTKRGLQVTLLEYGNSILPSMERRVSEIIQEGLIQRGITIITHTSVQAIETINNHLVVKGINQFERSADMVLISAGSIPNSHLGNSVGLETGLNGALKVNSRMETQIPDVYAAGDCVETWHKVLNAFTYLPLGTVAHKQGRVAGENMAGGNKEFAGTIGTQSLKVFDTVVAKTGFNEHEAYQAGFAPVSVDYETWDHKVYYPEARMLYIRVIADRDSHRILGAQMIGAHGAEVSKRIDLFSAAIYHELTVQEFSNYDLSYTPPLSSPWDPVQLAVQRLEMRLGTPR